MTNVNVNLILYFVELRLTVKRVKYNCLINKPLEKHNNKFVVINEQIYNIILCRIISSFQYVALKYAKQNLFKVFHMHKKWR